MPTRRSNRLRAAAMADTVSSATVHDAEIAPAFTAAPTAAERIAPATRANCATHAAAFAASSAPPAAPTTCTNPQSMGNDRSVDNVVVRSAVV